MLHLEKKLDDITAAAGRMGRKDWAAKASSSPAHSTPTPSQTSSTEPASKSELAGHPGHEASPEPARERLCGQAVFEIALVFAGALTAVGALAFADRHEGEHPQSPMLTFFG